MSKPQTSLRNPPATDHVRPSERKFWVWQDRAIRWNADFADSHNREERPWRWCCTLCDPPSYGFRCRKGAWKAIMAVSMPRHFFVRGQHHAWAARNRRG